jgi:MoaA/NifB/PqqE/SkfB family radical SAM enzyme
MNEADSSSKNSVIEVEISPICNLRCTNCNNSKRLHVPASEKPVDSHLDEEIIKFVPKNSILLFIGLGEPLIPKIQEKIFNILSKRKDLLGFIQTNGSFKVKEGLVKLIKEKRLSVGISYDEHHFNSGQKIQIQKELVEAVAIAVSSETKINESYPNNLVKLFPNVNRILIEPLIDEDNTKITIGWKEIEAILELFAKKLKVSIYTEMYLNFINFIGFKKYYKQAIVNLKKINENWFYSPKKFHVYVGDAKKSYIRILANGRVIDDFNDVVLSWKELEKSPKIKEFFSNS